MEGFWDSLASLTFRSEGDVIGRFVHPLLTELGWPANEVHSCVPVTFQIGRKTVAGRKPEADLVLAPESPSPPKIAWVVLEVKRPDQSLDDAASQAWSYTLALKAPIYVTTNGRQLQVWRVQYGKHDLLALDVAVDSLGAALPKLQGILSRESVRALLNRLQGEPSSADQVDVRDYLIALGTSVPVGQLAPRTLPLARSGNGKRFEWPDDISPKARIQLNGPSGRGKSACLQLAIQRSLSPDQRLLPVRIALRPWHKQGLGELIRTELAPFLAKGTTLDQLLSMVRAHALVVCLDDWDRASEECRSNIVRDLAAPEFREATVLIANRGPDESLGLVGFEQLTVGTLTKNEQDEIVGRRLGELGARLPSARSFWSIVPGSLKPVLGESIFLSCALDLLELSPHQGLSLPTTAGDLLDHMFRAVAAKVGLSGTAVDVAAQALETLSSAAPQFTLADFSSGLAGSQQQDAAQIADALVSCAVLSRTRAAEYEYAHEVWRSYFQVRREARGIVDDATASAWVTQRTVATLRQHALLMSSCVRERESQSGLLRALLRSDLVAYMEALRGRADTTPASDRGSFELRQIVDGHQEFIEQYFPTFKTTLTPWSVSDSRSWTMPPQISGSVDDNHLSYRMFLGDGGPVTDRDLLGRGFTGQSFTLAAAGLRRDSGRLIATRRVLHEVEDILRKASLPPSLWTTSEQLRKVTFELLCYGVRRSKLETTTAKSMAKWASDQKKRIEKMHGEIGPDDDVAIARDGKDWDLASIAAMANELIRLGVGQVPLAELGLPGPDLALGHGGMFVERYSHDQRRRRLSALFRAVCVTYKSLCEGAFARLSSNFFYGRGPVRAEIYLPAGAGEWITWWWAPAKSWDEQAVIRDESPPHNDDLFEEVRARYAAAGRDSSRFSVSSGAFNWAPYDPTVTEMVARMLRDDVKRLLGMLQTAR